MKKKARGYEIITGPEGVTEADTFTCCHSWCGQKVVRKPAFSGPYGGDKLWAWCTCCDAPMCFECIGKPCSAVERWLESQETKRNYEEHL
jgi:hypothetical protein